VTVVELGNVRPVETVGGLYHSTSGPVVPEVAREMNPLLAHTTTIVLPDGHDPARAAAEVALLWPSHSTDGAGWVRASDAEVDEELRDLFGLKPIVGPTMLLTNAGLDFFAKQAAGAASATAVAKWIALTANATAAGATDTTLTAEIVTGGGGLIRAAGTYAHTAAATTYTVSNTFAANGSDALPVTLAKVGAFDAASVGNMVFETLLSATATLSASGDSLALTWTITL